MPNIEIPFFDAIVCLEMNEWLFKEINSKEYLNARQLADKYENAILDCVKTDYKKPNDRDTLGFHSKVIFKYTNGNLVVCEPLSVSLNGHGYYYRYLDVINKSGVIHNITTDNLGYVKGEYKFIK